MTNYPVQTGSMSHLRSGVECRRLTQQQLHAFLVTHLQWLTCVSRTRVTQYLTASKSPQVQRQDGGKPATDATVSAVWVWPAPMQCTDLCVDVGLFMLPCAQGFDELIKHRQTVRLFTGNVDQEQVDSFCAEDLTPQVWFSIFIGELSPAAMLMT